MPRSSRHKSSKHSSRDAKDYSGSEEESGSRERRGGAQEGGSRILKDSGFSEKRRLESKDGKDVHGSGNGDYVEDHGSSKRRKDKFSDGVSDRWNGGDDEGSNRVKSSSESKSRRREDDNEDAGRSGKSEKHRETSRKEGKESERKEREGKGEKMEEKQEIATDSRTGAASESEKTSDKRIRKRRETFDDGAKYKYEVEDTKDKRAYSGNDAGRGAKQKEEKLRDERHRDKYREEVNKDSKNRQEKHKDDYPAKDRNGGRSTEKYSRDENYNAETRPKKSKPHDCDRENNSSHELDGHKDRKDRVGDKDRDHDRDREWDDEDRNRERDREWVPDRERDRPSIREEERDSDWERHDRDYADRSIRSKDSRGKKRPSEDHDGSRDSKVKEAKTRSSNMAKRSSSSTKVEADDDRVSKYVLGISRGRTSPTPSSHGGIDEVRHEKEEDIKHRDSSKESRSRAISPRESDRGPKYPPFDKNSKSEDGNLGEFLPERSLGSKASPRGLTERSPSSSSLERSRHSSRPGVRRNLDSEETGKRSGNSSEGRDFHRSEGRVSRELSVGRKTVDESSHADSTFHSRSGPNNSSSLVPPQPPRRNNDPNLGRGSGNNWRGVQNWPLPMPNSYIPFPHGPNLPAMMTHFPTPPIFGIRPPIEIYQPSLPYHMADADRFPGHLRPIGWQNMIDPSGFPRFHGWEDPRLYQGADWDQNRHLMNIRGWDTNSDPWKGQNGDLSANFPLTPKKDDDTDAKVHGSTSGDGQQPNVQDKSSGEREEIPSSKGDIIKSPPPLETEGDPEPDSSKSPEVDKLAQLSRAYLSKLDISAELAGPEMYEQCMSSLGGEKGTSTDDGSPAVRVVLEDQSNTMQEMWGGSLRGSLLPARDDSVLKKAMDHYKKQRLEPWSSLPLAKSGLLDEDSSTNEDKVDDHDRALSEDKPDETVDEKKPDDEINLETPIASSPAEEKPDDKLTEVKVEEAIEVAGGSESIPEARTSSPPPPPPPIGKTTVSSPLVDDGFVGEGIEASMPNESNIESKMASLSRIQQSPESTH